MNKRIGFIGCGNMGKAMLGSLVKSKDINNEDIMVSTKSNTSAQNIIKEFNVKATTINSEVTKNSDIIFLAVKPFLFKEVIEEIKDVVKEDVIIISIAAGVTIEQDADVVMFLYRDEYYNKETEEKGIGECIIAKQRNGPVGTVKMAWIGAHSKFADLELVHKE